MDTINYMIDNKKFKNLVIYWASDYAASMLENLPTDKGVFAMTSTNATET